jgi:hypothetical protein
VSIVVAVVCALGLWESARIGFARTYAVKALASNGLESAERSVQLLPGDAEVHAARGVVLQRTEDYPNATRELERAIQLRPDDYFLWLLLGVTRDLNDDQQGGLAAMRESVRLAPFYAKPRWQIGNLLLRMGQVEEAFQQMRFAEERDAGLLPNVIDLAWGTTRNDPASTVDLIQPRRDESRMALAIFFAAHKEGAAALEQFRNVKSPGAADLDRLTQRLIGSRLFAEAYEIWTRAHCPSCKPASFINGSFEADLEIGNQVFGWQVPANVNGVTLSVDTAEHETGTKSLRIDFRGNPDPQTILVSQMMVVEPGRRYRISLRGMTRSFVSVAGPTLRVVDASDDRLPPAARLPIQSDASGWQPYSTYFTSGPGTRAVRLVLNREDCPNNYCPAFGTLWLDSFVLEEARESNQ